MKEKRMIEDYEVLQSVHIGGREVIVAESQERSPDEGYLLASGRNGIIGVQFSDCVVSSDYAEIMQLFGQRVSDVSKEIAPELHKPDEQGIPTTRLTEADCTHVSYSESIENKVVVIDADVLRPEYRKQAHQLHLCVGGFGSYGNSRGSACYCKSLYDGSEARYERSDVIGVIAPDKLPAWAKPEYERLTGAEKEAESTSPTRIKRIEAR